MRALPLINNKYWLALLLASIWGTNTGDFFSEYLHLGNVAGLPYLAAIVVLVIAAEKYSKWASPLYFWAAIITARTGATNVADAFHQYGIGFNISVPIAFAAFAASVLIYRAMYRGGAPEAESVQVTPIYWLCMVLAGILGTVGGDCLAFATGLFPPGAALVGGPVLGAMLYWGRDGRLAGPVNYWITLAMIRTFGTSVGDTMAHNVLNLPAATIADGIVFLGAVYYFYVREDANLAQPLSLSPQAA